MNKFLAQSILWLFLFRCTIFVNEGIYNVIFGGFILLISAVYLVKQVKRPQPYYIWAIWSVALIIILQSLISVIYFKKSGSLFSYALLRYLLLAAIFYMGILSERISLRFLGSIFFILISFHLIYALYQLGTGDLLMVGEKVRLNGIYDSTGQFGTYIGFTSLLLYAQTKNGNKKYKIIWLTLLILSLLALAFNNTIRIIGCVFAALFLFYIIERGKIKYIIILLFLMSGIFLFNVEALDRIINMLFASYSPDQIMGTKLDNSFQWRILQWYLLTYDFFLNYFPMGSGLGQETLMNGFKTPEGTGFVSHSDFIKMIIENGVLGLFFYISIFWRLFLNTKKLKIQIGLEWPRLLFYFFMLAALLGNTLTTTSFMIFLFALGYFTTIRHHEIITDN